MHVSTYPVNSYSVSIYRMGYYGGAGARLMRSLGPLQGTAEPTPKDGERNLVECNWKVGFSLEIPARLAERRLPRKAVDAAGAQRPVPGSGDEERGLRHLHRPRRPQGRPAVPGVRHDLAVVQPLAAVAFAVRPGHRSLGRIQRQGRLRRRLRSALCALLERIPGRVPSADQRLRRIPDDRVPAGVLAGEGGLRRHLHLQRRHARRREGAASRESVPLGRPRRVLDRAHVRERHAARATPASASPSCPATRFQASWSCCRQHATAAPTGSCGGPGEGSRASRS